MRAPLAAAYVGAGAATVRRWAARDRNGLPLREQPPHRGGPQPITAEQRGQLETIVRRLEGLAGAEALRHAVPGVSRRAAAAVKREVCTRLEIERKARCTRIQVLHAGILRGFDAVEARAGDRWGSYLFRMSDGSLPYITSMPVVPRYDSRTVADAIEKDWAHNGVPYVQRLDRAASHRTAEMRDLAEGYGVLLLHGPPYHAQFYGQLERGNGDVRVLLDRARPSGDVADAWTLAVRDDLNALWPRRSLGYRTPAELWAARPRIVEDRSALRAEVADRAERLRWTDGLDGDLAERLAIEQALIARGWLRREVGGWC